MSRALRRLISIALATLVLISAATAEGRRSAPDPMPISLAAGIERAFAGHRLVAITDPRTPAMNRTLVSLIRDSKFRAHARVLVYDCCAPRYQGLIDRYVNGDNVSFAAVSHVWARAGPPIPRPNLFVQARKLNRRLPAAERIRILLAHPWAPAVFRCKQGQRCLVWGDRLDRVVAEVVERNIFRRHEKALLLAGPEKLDRRRRPANPAGYGFDSAARRIERRHPGSLFIVWAMNVCPTADSTADELIASWARPRMADIRGTSVGAAPETLLWGCRGSGLRGLPLAPAKADRPVERDVDAIIKVGR
ncbi:MAG: hypothetical protein ACJ752_04375 [Gaiellaceae bacterium]